MTTPQLNSLNIETTAITRLGTLDSDDPERNFPQQPQPQVQSVELPGVNFDFLNHVYYINVRLNKSQSNPAALAGTPRIIAIQICSIIVIG